MVKGLFTQGICVLLERPLELERVEAALSGFEVVGRHVGAENEDPTSTLILKFRPEVEGHVLVSLSNNPWPDDMGDPDDAPDSSLPGLWASLARSRFLDALSAPVSSHGSGKGQEAVTRHRAHIRLLTSYVLGAEETDEEGREDMPLTPTDYDSVGELQYLMRV